MPGGQCAPREEYGFEVRASGLEINMSSDFTKVRVLTALNGFL